jgi:hypothetical protein
MKRLLIFLICVAIFVALIIWGQKDSKPKTVVAASPAEQPTPEPESQNAVPTHNGSMDALTGMVSAKGKWKPFSTRKEHQQLYDHAIEIDCFKGDTGCIVADASIVGGKPKIDLNYLHH